MASRAEHKSQLDAMSEEELLSFLKRFGGAVSAVRDANISRLLDDADGQHGDSIDRRLSLPTDDELSRQREERSVRANWVSAMAAMLALLISTAALTKGELWNFPTRSDPIATEGQTTP